MVMMLLEDGDYDEYDRLMDNVHDAAFSNLRRLNRFLGGRHYSERDLRIVQLNARSVKEGERFDDVVEKLSQVTLPFDFIVMTETWFDVDVCCLRNISGYEPVDACRTDRLGGGVSIFIRKDLNYEILRNYVGQVEEIAIRLRMGGGDITVAVLYKPPRCGNGVFLDYLDERLMENTHGRCMILGDMNVHVSGNTTAILKYRESLQSFGFKVINEHVTRPESNSLLDHVIVNFNVQADIMTADIGINSDHLPIIVACKLIEPIERINSIVVRHTDFTKADIALERNLNELQDSSNANGHFTHLS